MTCISRPLAVIPELEGGVAAEREAEGGWSVGPAFSIPIPLFDQGQGTVARAEAQLRRARHAYAAQAVDLRARVRAAHAAVVSGRDRAEHYRSVILPLRQQIVEQTQLQYNAMQVGAFQLLQARRDQVQSGSDYVAALRDYWTARTDLDTILAGRLAGAASATFMTPRAGAAAPQPAGEHR
jgi:cobalt-zinc-cadmium efflux system outer membrane protein